MNTDSDTLPPGTLLGHYKLISPAAKGGFGVLYRAWDDKLKRPVAIKECFPAAICHRDAATGHVQPHNAALRTQYEAALNDAYEEAQTLSGLHHAHVVPVYDIFRAAGSLFFVMPWLEGGSLRDKIAAGEKITQEESARWLLSLLSALEYLHNRQIIHRDLKPGNIMFDADGNPMLVDFGSVLNRATKVDTTTQGEFSPVYASPEQVSGKGRIGPWTDLYSLAATWYELLTGTAPEPAQQRLVRDDLRPLPSGGSVLEQSIMQNLALAASERCQSAREWRDWLQADKTPLVIARRRRSTLLWSIPVLLLGAGGIYYVGTRQAEPPPPAPQPSDEKIIPDEAFFNQVCQTLRLDEHAQVLGQITQKSQSMLQEYRRKVDEMVKRQKEVENSSVDYREKERQMRANQVAYRKLQRETLQMFDTFSEQGYKAHANLLDACASPDTVYPWGSTKEFHQLRHFQPLLEKKYKSCMKDFIEANEDVRTQINSYGVDELWETEKALQKAYTEP